MGAVTLPQSSWPVVETLEFAQNAEVDSRIKRVIPEICRRVAGRLSRKPLAILLTGSFARGEGSAFILGKRLKALSDMEFLVLCPHGSNLDAVQQMLDFQARALARWVTSRDIECQLEFNAVSADYLRRLHPHIFGYELLTHARTVWGNENVLADAPRFPASAIPRWDAWRMVNNRLLEQLQWADIAEQRDSIWLQSAFYHVLKCYLDLATTVLIFEGRYRSRYTERNMALKEWARSASNEVAPFAEVLAERVAACTEFKLHPHPGRLPLGISLDRDPQVLSAQVRHVMVDLASVAHQVWRWAAMALTGLSCSSLADDEILNEAARRSQPLYEKLRGWAKIALMAEVRRQPNFFRGMGKLLLKASPRYLIYSVTSELYFRLPEAVAGGSPGVGEREHLLPVRFAQHARERRPWWRLRADALLGWKLFLRSHRA